MRKILLVAYYFPPLLASESIRSMRTVKYLPRFGYEPVVLTTDRIEGKTDQSLLDELPREVAIHRTPFVTSRKIRLPLRHLRSLIRYLCRWKHIDHYKVEWLAPAIALGSRILKEGRIEAILSRSTPIASHLVGFVLKAVSGLPWIADFSDPWTQNPFFSANSMIHNLEVLAERLIANSCDKIVFTSSYTREAFLRQHPGLSAEKVEVIPNSFDPADYEGLAHERTSKFTMTYVGNLYHQRSPESFFKALARLKKEGRAQEMLVRFIGDMGPYKHLRTKYGLDDIVEVLGVLRRKEAISYLFRSDVLLLIDAPSAHPSMFLPMKLVEYLPVGRPILALTPKEGSSSDVVRSTKTGMVVAPRDELAIRDALINLHVRHMTGGIESLPDEEEIQTYSIEHCTAQLADVLGGLGQSP